MHEALSNFLSKTFPNPFPNPLTPEKEDRLSAEEKRLLAEVEYLADRADMKLCESPPCLRRNAFVVGDERCGVIPVAFAICLPDDDDVVWIHEGTMYFAPACWDPTWFQGELDSLHAEALNE